MAKTTFDVFIIFMIAIIGILFKDKIFELLNYVFKELPLKLFPSQPIWGLAFIFIVIGLLIYWSQTR